MELYSAERIDDKTFIIKDNEADVRFYAVLGAERAVVVDTGTGKGDIRGFTESLIGTGYPVFSVHTRTSEDATGGAYLFDEAYFRGKADTFTYPGLQSEVQKSHVLAGMIKDGDHFHLGGVHIGIWEAPGPWNDRVCVRMTREGVFTATFAGDYLEFADEIIENYGNRLENYDCLDIRGVKFGRKDIVIYAEGIISLSEFIDKDELIYSAHTDAKRLPGDLQFMARMLKKIARSVGAPSETTGAGELIEVSDGVVVGYNPRTGVDELEIPEGIKGIDRKIFYGSNLYRVKFPSTLSYIGDSAFEFSRNLTEARLPEGFKSFGTRCFAVTGLEEIHIPPKVTELPDGTFDGCMGYEELLVPGHVKRIGAFCFSANRRVKKVSIGEGVESIGRRAFNGNPDMESLSLPVSLYSVESYAFDGSGAPKSVTVSGTVKEVWKEFLCGNQGIREVVIEDGVESISIRAFAYCTNLEKVVIPASVRKIGFRAFSGCASLKIIEVPVGAEIDETAFAACPADIMRYN